MESVLPLGCILDKSSMTLRITSDPKERKTAAIFAAVFGLAFLLAILLTPFSRLGWAGLIVFGCAGVGCSLFAFSVGLYRTEIEFDAYQGQVVRRRLCVGRIRSVSALPLDRLKAIRVVRKGRGAGELQLIQSDGKVWAKWVFLVEPFAEETCMEILTWLQARSPYNAPEGFA